ncbi:MAG: hypothetical protein AUI10_12590 [Actinobacteria bacterium 13_2_20CM_2_72_6]|nr:MAG: hypothetical protein AUI10_12590 [Actinobacteria bacterium 13_2_20CM_2_72_6]
MFGVPELWSAYFLAAFGTGTLAGSFWRGREPSFRTAAWCLCALSIAIIALPLVRSFWLGILAVLIAGAAFLMVGSTTQTLLLNLAGPHRAGRVMAVWAVAFAGSRPVATAIDTWLAGVVNAKVSTVVLALPALVVSVAVLGLRASARGHRWALGVLRDAIPGPLVAVPQAGK